MKDQSVKHYCHDLPSTPIPEIGKVLVTGVTGYIGGKMGWFNSNWMWRLRGALDSMMMGVGVSRGRRSSSELKINDVIDFWRVENIIKERQLLLRAEMMFN